MKIGHFLFQMVLTLFLLSIFSLAWSGDYIPQTIGMYDTTYELQYSVDCRGCHGSDLAIQHHALGIGCVYCHTQQINRVDDCLACHDGHDPESHHAGQAAGSWSCIDCHDSTLVGQFNFSGPVSPGYAVSYVTPRPYRCKVCHNRSPNPPGLTDPDPPLVGIDGESASTNTHHNTRGEVYNLDTCDNCHDSSISHTDPIQMRYCERCHTLETLHQIAPHNVSAHCNGCHTDTVAFGIVNVWTSDWKGRPRNQFVPGDEIRLNVKFRIIGNPDVQQEFKLWGTAFGLPDNDWEIDLENKFPKLYPGEYIKKWKETVPLEAVPGTEAKVKMTLKHVDGSVEKELEKAFFNIVAVDEPVIYYLDPWTTLPTRPGDGKKVLVMGLNFGDNQDVSILHIGGKSWSVGHPKIKTWQDHKIKFKVPAYEAPFPKAKEVWVTIDGKDSNKVLLQVAAP